MRSQLRFSRLSSVALVGVVCAASPALAAPPYDANPTLGAPGTPTVDGANTGEWGPQNLIYRGLANDDPRSLGDNWTMHETPWDLTHLYATWDDDALTLAWQYVDVTDVVDPANAGSAGASSPGRMDLVQWIALDTQPGAGSALDMWHKNSGEPYWTGDDLPDHQIYIASNLWQGYISTAVDGVFPVDDGGVHYFPLADAGIEVAVAAGFAGDTLLGVDDADHTLDPAAQRDFLVAGHSTARDTFYELRIPLAALGLTRVALEANGLGVMIGQGEGSCLDTLPHDAATLDTPGTSPSNSPLEWGDVDHFTTPFARVAHVGGAVPPDGGTGADAGSANPPDGSAGPVSDGGVAPLDAVAPGTDTGGGPVTLDATGPGPTPDGAIVAPGADTGLPPAQDAGLTGSILDAGVVTPGPGGGSGGGGGGGCTVSSGRAGAPWAVMGLFGAVLGLSRTKRRR